MGTAPACAAATGPHAALVIETGTRDVQLCVALDAPSVSGTHLIELAGAQQHLAYAFGSGGQAVCRLAGTGPQGDDCFADYPDFWGYWRSDGGAAWTWSSTGAASTGVGDGDLEGWVWGSGDTGSTHARPPALAIADVCVTPSPSPTAASPTAAAPTVATHMGTTSSTPTATKTHAPPSPEPTVPPARTPTGSTAAPSVLAAGEQGSPPASGGPGAGLYLALALGAALAGGGWLRVRASRRRQGAERS
jgi:hypothetical protein